MNDFTYFLIYILPSLQAIEKFIDASFAALLYIIFGHNFYLSKYILFVLRNKRIRSLSYYKI